MYIYKLYAWWIRTDRCCMSSSVYIHIHIIHTPRYICIHNVIHQRAGHTTEPATFPWH
jgi:hypothetical protein